MRHIFILGCERSGSTWLSNILDAHPGVEFFMEPFADYALIFREVPERNVYLSQVLDNHIKDVKAGYDSLHKLKYPWFYRRGRDLYLKKWDQTFFRVLGKVYRKFRKRIPLYLQRYELLQLNSAALPLERLTKKHKKPMVGVTKELRLNFKVELLNRVFPDVKVLVILRHPGAQIASVMRLFSRNSLGELGKNLESFICDIKKSKRFDKYLDVIGNYDWEKDLEIQLVLWWLINYDVMLEDLERLGVDYKVIHHEELSERAVKQTENIFKFIGLDVSPDVSEYLGYSTGGSKSGETGKVDTRRESASFYKQAIEAVPAQLNNKIHTIANKHKSVFHPRLTHCQTPNK